MSVLRKHHHFVSAIVLLGACTFSSACMAWHTASLQPLRFNTDSSARLTLSDGTRLIVKHPVMVGDSLVWVHRSGASRRDSARSAIPTSDIRKVEVRRVDALRTIGLLVGMGAVAFSAGVVIALSNIEN